MATLQVQSPFPPAPIDAAGAAGFRLSEVSLHSWDVFGTFDPAAALAPDAAALLVDRLPTMVSVVGHFTPRETRPAQDTTIRVTTSDPSATTNSRSATTSTCARRQAGRRRES